MHLRSATQADQLTIKRIIRDENLNPMSLDWRHFVVAENDRGIVGIGQMKQHSDGSRELASIAVVSEQRGQGIASEIIRALLAQESGYVYLTCRDKMEPFYNRFGFRKIGRTEMTPYFRRLHRIGNVFARLAGTEMLVMKTNIETPRRDVSITGNK